MKKKRKNIITIIAIFIAVGILVTGGIVAYLTDTDQKTNVFTVGSVKINVTESNWNPVNGQDILPGDTINKDPAIENIGKNSAYVYIKIEQPSVTLANNTEGGLFSYTTNSGWTLLGTNVNQGCPTTTSVYYYNTALAKNTTTPTLFNNVTINDFTDLSDTFPMNIVVTGYAIQSNNLPSGTTIPSAYSTYFENSGLAGCTTPIIQATYEDDTTAFRSDTYRDSIKTITLDDQINPPADVVTSWDIGVHQNGDVMAYIAPNSNDNTMYDLYIQGNGALYANPDSSYLFANLGQVSSIDGIDKLNISKVTNMAFMFYGIGYGSSSLDLDLGDKFDTRNVTNMKGMFDSAGYYNQNFTLDLGSKFDTSKVTDMSGMFHFTGYYSQVYFLELGDKFDTRNVTNMRSMFYGTGASSSLFTLDLGSKFDTSKVTDMENMFADAGRNSSLFTLDLGNKFDTRNVTNMAGMFWCTGWYAPLFTLDLRDKFDTSKVTNMSRMFDATAYNTTDFTLDLGEKFDTSKVTNMQNMFSSTGYYSQDLTLDLGEKFDTSKVTNMAYMFKELGYSNPTFTLDLGEKFDTNNVTNMGHMFDSTGYNSSIFTLELGNKFDTSNVTDMRGMFSNIGNANNSLVLDLSTFDFSSVTLNSNMFDGIKTSSIVYVGNDTARSWVIARDNNLTTNNVLIKP